MFSFNTLLFIVAAIVPVCMFIHAAYDVRDALRQPPSFVHLPEFTQYLQSPQQQHINDKPTESSYEVQSPVFTLEMLESLIEVDDIQDEIIDIIQLAKSRLPMQQIIDYSKMTIRELKAIAKLRKLKGYGDMRKSELVAALR